jgi:DNA modification methylase
VITDIQIPPARIDASAPSGSLHGGDCLTLLQSLSTAVDLAYLDPPFFSGSTRQGSTQCDRSGGSFNDRWPSLDHYLDFMRPRIEAVHRALKPHGVILLHCDWRASHRLRVMLDEIFTPDGFVNHLVWSYGLGGSSPRRFARKHDDILFFAKGPDYHFDPPRVPATSRRMSGQLKKATDVIDVPAINNMSHERTGYPTQKPLALLELLVGACSPPDGVVLDPFCGSGTTLVAAQRLGRRWIGMDANPDAIAIAQRRLKAP